MNRHIGQYWFGLGLKGVLVVVLFLMGISPFVYAATFNVPAGNVNELITAINNANNETLYPGPDTIELAANSTYTLTAVNNPDWGNNGLPVITSSIAINGNGAIIERSSSGGTPDFRIFEVSEQGDLTLNDLTLRNGKACPGGGILNLGTLTINRSIVSGNLTPCEGGGILNAQFAILNINESIIENNSSQWRGGGVASWWLSVIIINGTIFSNNSASVGGAIANGDAPIPSSSVMILNNCTISGNSAKQGGGIHNTGTLIISHSTITANLTMQLASNIINYGAITLKNSIINSSSSRNCFNPGEIASQGYNLSNDRTCNLTYPSDFPNTDPLLGPLADNGGPTQTHALLPGSPAIDAIPLADCTDAEGIPVSTDQRGVARPQGTGCDIGAFEREGFALTVIKNGTGSGTVTSNPAGINCGADCEQGYDPNTAVTLTATPDPGSVFAGWGGDPDCTDGQVTMNANKTCTATFSLAPLCQGVTAISSPPRVTFRRANQQATIRVTIRNNSGAARTVTAITPQADEPFAIVRISPLLPRTINNRSSRVFTVTVRGPAGGPFPVVATQPYFDTALDCGVLTTATEPRLLVPLRIENIQAELQGDHVLVEARGEGIASVQLQLFDLKGKQLLNQASNTTTLALPTMDSSGQPLANGVYLYVMRVRGYDGQEYVSEIRKLVIVR